MRRMFALVSSGVRSQWGPSLAHITHTHTHTSTVPANTLVNKPSIKQVHNELPPYYDNTEPKRYVRTHSWGKTKIKTKT